MADKLYDGGDDQQQNQQPRDDGDGEPPYREVDQQRVLLDRDAGEGGLDDDALDVVLDAVDRAGAEKRLGALLDRGLRRRLQAREPVPDGLAERARARGRVVVAADE